MSVCQSPDDGVLENEFRRVVLVIEIDLGPVSDVRAQPHLTSTKRWCLKMQLTPEMILIAGIEGDLVAGVIRLAVAILRVASLGVSITRIQLEPGKGPDLHLCLDARDLCKAGVGGDKLQQSCVVFIDL